MKTIPLTQGRVALVEDEDYEWLSQWNWFAKKSGKTFYAERSEKLPDGRWATFRMNRQILGLKHGDKRQGDHINHDTLDNRRANLRIVTKQQNMWNQKKSRRGFAWNKRAKKWYAYIGVNGQKIHLGVFEKPEEARRAYLKAKAIYHQIGKVA